MCVGIYICVCVCVYMYRYIHSVQKKSSYCEYNKNSSRDINNLAAKDSRLECTCMNNDNFTVLVSRGGRHCQVSMCTVWPSHSND